MIISVFSRLFSIIVAFWAFSILDFWLTFGCVLYEGTNVFSKYWPSKSGCVLSSGASYTRGNTMWAPSPWGFSEMKIQPARHECLTCCPLQAEKPGIQPAVGHMHGTHVEQVVSLFQKILRGSQLTHGTVNYWKEKIHKFELIYFSGLANSF